MQTEVQTIDPTTTAIKKAAGYLGSYKQNTRYLAAHLLKRAPDTIHKQHKQLIQAKQGNIESTLRQR